MGCRLADVALPCRDLGFDPISESNKALLNLLEEEKTSPKEHALRYVFHVSRMRRLM